MKLFRKIRRKSLESGKLKNYLLYAIGEILLIVIGILVAWKINDLNEIRKNKVVEVKIYDGLYEELRTNLTILDSTIAHYPDYILRLQRILGYVGLEPDELTQGAKDTIINLHYRKTSLLDGAINSVISTTKFELIESEVLKKSISTYPSDIDNLRIIDQKINDIIVRRQQPTLEKYLSLADMLPSENAKYNSIKAFGARSNYSELLRSKDFQNSIVDRLLQSENLLVTAVGLRRKTENIAYHLSRELE